MTAITGNTFPVRVELRQMGGQWNPASKAWMVPDDVADMARAAVAQVSDRARPDYDCKVWRKQRTYGRNAQYGSRYTRFAGGGEHYVNRSGRCEDAPCCGCCS